MDASQGLPVPMGKRHVVMHHEHGVHHLPHQQVVEMEVELVVVLVILHLVALCFWMWLLFADKERRKSKRVGSGADVTQSPGGAASGAPARMGAAARWSDWRTPREILASWGKQSEKQRLGKV